MKKIFIAIILIFTIYEARSADKPPVSVICTNPVKYGDLWKFYNLSYHQAAFKHSSFGGTVLIPSQKEVKGFGISFEYRISPFHMANRGFYIALRQSYFSLEEADQDIYVLAIGATLAWNAIAWDHLSIGVGFGMDGFSASSKLYDNLQDYATFLPDFRFELGYAF